METLDKARLCLKIIKERKAIDPVLFEVGELTSIADHLKRRMRDKGFRAYGVEGEQKGHWVLMDYGDVVIHIFYQPVREFYDLEGLWMEAPKVELHEDIRQKYS
jgi:ribosome-associated protein